MRRFIALVVVCFASLQLFFAVRIASMRVVDPQSTTLQRSEAWRLALSPKPMSWHQAWTPYAALPSTLKRTVVAAEDAGFTEHAGIEWDAVGKAWGRNARAEAAAERAASVLARAWPSKADAARRSPVASKVVGGSTISQQLAKNLFLSGERNLFRKAQELVLTYELEALLGKRRILEIYLNSVEWGEGVFGAEAAARRYFGVGAASLTAYQAAQLAVLLPAPKRFEKRPASAYVSTRSTTIVERSQHVDVP